tara:strand:- start:672 stop:1124 length:453 start_codon:yes stop_codon:yes gene_type:complete
MATRSRIGIELQDSSILSVYHHWDGYPSWLGRILTTHYNSPTKALVLISGGDMSCAWTKERWTGIKVADRLKDKNLKEILETTEYGPQYYSQRGDNSPPRHDKDMEEFFSDGEEYSYIFRNGNWFAYDMHQFDDIVAPEPVEIPEGALAV